MGLLEVFAELAEAQSAGVLERYAIGGAVGATFYLEPVSTQDVDVFAAVRPEPDALLLSLEGAYAFFRARGATVRNEHLEIGGWLVQLLVPPTPLVEDALEHPVLHEVEGRVVPVFSLEHLAAIALQTGRLKDKLRLAESVRAPQFDHERFKALLDRFDLRRKWVEVQQSLAEEGP